MPQIKMRLASPRVMRARAVIVAPPDEPLVRGHGDIDYVCAGCDRVIAQNIAAGEIKNLVFECTGCGMDSRTPGAGASVLRPGCEQEALFYIEGLDKDGRRAWMHGTSSADPWASSLGRENAAAEVLSQWLLDRMAGGGERTMPGGTVERAYQLAPECRTLGELRARLIKEGCTNIDAHLGGSVRTAVKKLLKTGGRGNGNRRLAVLGLDFVLKG